MSILLTVMATCLVHVVLPVGGIPIPLLFGFLDQDDVRDQQWAILGRVSSASQLNNTSTETQIEEVKEECKDADGTVAYEYKLAESGASIDRESLEEIVEKGKNDEIDILGVSKFDRLMRADPWEAIKYIRELREAGVTLYVSTHGYFNYDDMFDFRVLVQQAVFSREWYIRLRGNSKDGQVSRLEEGKWPFGTPGYGYKKDDDDKLHLEEEKEPILTAIFEEYKNEKSKETVKDNIAARFEIDDLPTKSQVGIVLNNHLCVGELTYKNQVVSRNTELAVVDRDTFEKVAEIQHNQCPTSGDAPEIPEAIDRATADFNPEYIVELIQGLGKQCRKCGSDLRKYGTEERYGIKIQKYKCKSEECGYQGPLLTKKEMEKLHETLPIKCPYCPATERFNVTRESDSNSDSAWEFTYECQNCGKSFGSNEVEDIYERAKENPHLQFDWYEDNRGNINQDDDDESVRSTDYDDSGPDDNSTLDDFRD